MKLATHTLAATALLSAAFLLSAGPASAQITAGSEARSTIGQTFFGTSRTSASNRSGPDRWGVPKLRSLRGDHRKERTRSTVPINVNTLANGTANTPIPPRPQPRPLRSRRTLPSTVVQVNNRITVVNSAAPAERRGAVRSVDAARARAESSRSSRAPSDRDRREAVRTPAPEAASSGPPASRRTAVSRVPLVEPLVSPPTDEELDPRDCVTLRITTSGGIEWRHEVALAVLDASSVSGAASLLQGKLRRGEPLVVRSQGGGFTVPAAQVESLIVGPCR